MSSVVETSLDLRAERENSSSQLVRRSETAATKARINCRVSVPDAVLRLLAALARMKDVSTTLDMTIVERIVRQ
jgi:hypothetical protein